MNKAPEAKPFLNQPDSKLFVNPPAAKPDSVPLPAVAAARLAETPRDRRRREEDEGRRDKIAALIPPVEGILSATEFLDAAAKIVTDDAELQADLDTLETERRIERVTERGALCYRLVRS